MISAILRLVNATWRRPVTRCAEVITVFALMIGAMFPIIHLGRPWLFFWLILCYPAIYYLVFPYPRYRHPIEPMIVILGVFLISEAEVRGRPIGGIS